MKKLILLIFFINFTYTYSQFSNFFLSSEFKAAVENGTRTLDGIPGKNYWQNKSEYKINVQLLPDSGYLVGDETILYYNNSPDTLREIVIRLYQDIAKYGATRDWYVGKSLLNDEVKINYLIVENDSLDLSLNSRDIRRGSTNLIINLKNNIPPSSKVKLKIGWEFEIPKRLRLRMGNYGDGNFYIAYWYPQVAVYDDIDGWDMIDYEGAVEFYNDFSNFDVKILVPKGMLVWATGDLQNAEKVLRNDILEKYELAKRSDSTINILTPADYSKGLVTAGNEMNEWQFNAENVTDFSFATSKTFNWDGASVIVDSISGRRALTDVVYKDSTIHYDKSAQYARSTIEYLSHELPGFPYLYTHATSYCNGNRGGGMESPMMANNGAPSDRGRHIGLIFHEIAHNYFPFILGTNERKYAWMDEGWASFLPTEVVNRYVPDNKYRKRRISSYEFGAGRESDLPLIVPSYSYKTGLARLGFYDKPAVIYYELMELLGKENFKGALLEFMDRWKGKHPLPQDFFFTFNDVVGEDLSWFWKPWFYEYGYPDLGLSGLTVENNVASLCVNKIGNYPTRIELTVEFENGETSYISRSANVWGNKENSIKVEFDATSKIKKITLGNELIPDINKKNNTL